MLPCIAPSLPPPSQMRLLAFSLTHPPAFLYYVYMEVRIVSAAVLLYVSTQHFCPVELSPCYVRQSHLYSRSVVSPYPCIHFPRPLHVATWFC